MEGNMFEDGGRQYRVIGKDSDSHLVYVGRVMASSPDNAMELIHRKFDGKLRKVSGEKIVGYHRSESFEVYEESQAEKFGSK